MPGSNMKSDTNVKLPLSFIVFALIAFAASQIILFFNSSELLEGMFRIPKVWMSAHFLLLGFAVMTAMGAMYQLIPVTFLTSIWNQRLGFVQFFITAIGLTSFAILLGYRTNIAVYGGALVVIGILIFIFQMAKTIAKLEKASTMAAFVISALACLLLTITAGFLLAWNLAFGELFDHVSILLSHMTLGLAGWFTLLIMGLSYKMVPMFSLSHGFTNKWADPAFYTYLTGLAVTIISYWVTIPSLRAVGLLLLFLGYGFFALDMKEVLSKLVKKKLDKPFSFSITAIWNGLIMHFVALLAGISNLNSENVWGWIIYLYMMTWIIFSMLGYLYKIVPFLYWTHKYSEKVGKEKVPTLKEMMNEKLGAVLYRPFHDQHFWDDRQCSLRKWHCFIYFLRGPSARIHYLCNFNYSRVIKIKRK
ncbi:hypothetical protein R4Z10_06645 [Niallia sp. XMNu-256]|uniref:hypothetical protein n=1 Tax=Niallia sp. XMNu-256 TaxID=3082444 RepID=UPI0030D4052C